MVSFMSLRPSPAIDFDSRDNQFPPPPQRGERHAAGPIQYGLTEQRLYLQEVAGNRKRVLSGDVQRYAHPA
jgi:hypothetical protein